MGARQLSNHHYLHLKHKEASGHAVGSPGSMGCDEHESQHAALRHCPVGVWHFQQQETNLQLLPSKQKLGAQTRRHDQAAHTRKRNRGFTHTPHPKGLIFEEGNQAC